jgi:hypothetical protein
VASPTNNPGSWPGIGHHSGSQRFGAAELSCGVAVLVDQVAEESCPVDGGVAADGDRLGRGSGRAPAKSRKMPFCPYRSVRPRGPRDSAQGAEDVRTQAGEAHERAIKNRTAGHLSRERRGPGGSGWSLGQGTMRTMVVEVAGVDLQDGFQMSLGEDQ